MQDNQREERQGAESASRRGGYACKVGKLPILVKTVNQLFGNGVFLDLPFDVLLSAMIMETLLQEAKCLLAFSAWIPFLLLSVGKSVRVGGTKPIMRWHRGVRRGVSDPVSPAEFHPPNST